MELIISYPLQGLHNLAYDNVNPAMVNGNDIMSSMFATLWVLSERFDLKRSLMVIMPKYSLACSLLHFMNLRVWTLLI